MASTAATKAGFSMWAFILAHVSNPYSRERTSCASASCSLAKSSAVLAGGHLGLRVVDPNVDGPTLGGVEHHLTVDQVTDARQEVEVGGAGFEERGVVADDDAFLDHRADPQPRQRCLELKTIVVDVGGALGGG